MSVLQNRENKKALIESASGINWCKDMLATKEAYVISWEQDGKFRNAFKSEKIELNPELYTEIVLYSVIKCALNTLRVYDKADENISDEEIAERFKSEFPDFKYNSFPQETVTQKRLLRSGRNAEINPAKAMEFLDALMDYVKNN